MKSILEEVTLDNTASSTKKKKGAINENEPLQKIKKLQILYNDWGNVWLMLPSYSKKHNWARGTF